MFPGFKIFKLLFIGLLFVFLPGCKLLEINQAPKPQEVNEITRYDSIIYNTIVFYRDTIIYDTIPGETVYKTKYLYLPIGKDPKKINSDTSTLKTSLAWSWAVITRGKLFHSLKQNDTILEREIKSYQKQIITLKESIKMFEKRAEEPPGKAVFPVWAGILAFVAVIGVLGILFYFNDKIKNRK